MIKLLGKELLTADKIGPMPEVEVMEGELFYKDDSIFILFTPKGVRDIDGKKSKLNRAMIINHFDDREEITNIIIEDSFINYY